MKKTAAKSYLVTRAFFFLLGLKDNEDENGNEGIRESSECMRRGLAMLACFVRAIPYSYCCMYIRTSEILQYFIVRAIERRPSTD